MSRRGEERKEKRVGKNHYTSSCKFESLRLGMKNPKPEKKYKEDVWIRGECACVYTISPSFPHINQMRGGSAGEEGGR
jgi:hypothetical protein